MGTASSARNTNRRMRSGKTVKALLWTRDGLVQFAAVESGATSPAGGHVTLQLWFHDGWKLMSSYANPSTGETMVTVFKNVVAAMVVPPTPATKNDEVPAP